MQCPKCHHPNLPDVNHCEACGFGLRAYHKAQEKLAEQRRNFKLPPAPVPRFRDDSSPPSAQISHRREQTPQKPTPQSRNTYLTSFALQAITAGQIFPLELGTNTIGRPDQESYTRPTIDLSSLDTNNSVSRRHAEIRVTDTQGPVLLVDTNSSNGTLLNDKAVPPGIEQELVVGATLTFGSVRLTLISH